MSSFFPVDLNKTGQVISNATNLLPPTLSTQVGNKIVGQIGNSNLTKNIVGLAGGGQVGQLVGSLVKQESAFPYKKPVSFLLLDRHRRLAQPPSDGNGFAPGYFFKMLVNPSQFTVTPPQRTIVPTRTMGGWKIQHWYPEIGGITAEGMIGNMLERFNRDLKDSNAYRSFKKLLTVYQSNGVSAPYQGTGIGRTTAQDAFTPTAQCIYDKVVYEGYFENFSYTEAEDLPHSIRYNFTFKFLTTTDIDDMPGLTRDRAIDASVLNAVIPQTAAQSFLNGLG